MARMQPHPDPAAGDAGAISPWQCLGSPTGSHELIQHALVDQRDDNRFPCGTWLYMQCRHCHVFGRAFLEDRQIAWAEAPLRGNRPPV